MSDTVGLILIDEGSSRYPEFVRLKENLVLCGVQHDPQTLAQFIFYLNIRCSPHSSVDQQAFLGAVIAGWNKFRSLSVLSSYEKFYTTGTFDE
jgi:hypothetical protein